MFAFVPVLIGFLARFVTYSMVGRVLLSLGVSTVTFTGLTIGINTIRSGVISHMTAAGAAMNFAFFMHIDICVTMIFSAILGNWALKGLSAAGKLTQFAKTS